MRPVWLLAWFFLAGTIAWALPAADVAHNRTVQQTAAGLIREQRVPEARAYLLANIRADAGPDDKAMEVAQGCLAIVFQFRLERKQSLAKAAASLAFETLRPYLEGRPAPVRCAEIYTSLGLVCEGTLYDLPAAESYYQAALALSPGDTLTANRLAQIRARLAARAAAGP